MSSASDGVIYMLCPCSSFSALPCYLILTRCAATSLLAAGTARSLCKRVTRGVLTEESITRDGLVRQRRKSEARRSSTQDGGMEKEELAQGWSLWSYSGS